MKREFLQALKVADQPLTKEIVDAIMAENGRDIAAAKETAAKPYADYDALCRELETLRREATAEGKTALQWKQAHDCAVQAHSLQLAGVRFEHTLAGAISASGGRNAKAITALLDLEALKASPQQETAIRAALEDLKKDCGYLFEDKQIPPVYAAGTGTQLTGVRQTEDSLAGALREKYERK